MKRIKIVIALMCGLIFSMSAQDKASQMQKATLEETGAAEYVYLETASWGQNYPFNLQCWTDASHTTQAKSGCVPTAYAIVMRYHQWPETGIGKLYDCQSFTIIEDRKYDWENMPLVYNESWTDEQKNEAAKIMSHIGHAFMVTYGSGSTSVSDPRSTYHASRLFDYGEVIASRQGNFSFDQWKDKIKESLDNGCPVIYAADNAGTGDTRHMFVVDGYTNNNYFHFNFGWNGAGNGWFKLDNIKPYQGDDYSWKTDGTSDHYAIFNFTPNKPATSIGEVVEDLTDNAVSSVIYDLQGRRVNEITTAGIYIVNGKKIVVK